MIRVVKGAKPQVLVDSEVVWTEEFLQAREAGNDIPDVIRYRYRHPQIKAALRDEAHGKCVYCETKVPVGETDHFLPVLFRPELIVQWGNLVLVCKECNTKKGAYYSVDEPLIDPCNEDPAEHVYFFGPALMPFNGSLKGLRTILKLQLSRPELIQVRFDRVERLRPLVDQWRALPDGETKELVKQEIVREASDTAEFAALIRAYLFQELGWTITNAGDSP